MTPLRLLAPDLSSTRQKAIQDAQRVQASIYQQCATPDEVPPYTLDELIGKGSFGRVYKATSNSGRTVAVKIISIDEGDSLDPKRSDTFGDILKEVNTLKILGTSGAKNVNVVIDALLFGQSMWVVTELCAGGSVATLMRPTGGLPRKWIVPILREVAVAIHWVHKEGIIHRDIKCANVLVTDTGQVQLCDFGVAGIIQNRSDKRSTVTGTLQWMAPELFDSHVSYGTEVDIWAFGSLAYEVAVGLPPNATKAIDPADFGEYLKQNAPRLEGDQYSTRLKDLVASCMVNDPKKRPPIELVQMHPYINNTEKDYPTESLSKLVNAYRLWESQGGSRQSLFAAGGAMGPPSESPSKQEDEWDFDSDGPTQPPLDDSETQAVYDAYGSRVDIPPQPLQRRRRKPIPNLQPFKAPLQKVFDPHTIANYHDHIKDFYSPKPRSASSDLPLRDNTQQPKLRESLIDMDVSTKGFMRIAPKTDDMTIRPAGKLLPSAIVDDDNRRTRDWTFPIMSPFSSDSNNPRFTTEKSGPSSVETVETYRPDLISKHPSASLSPDTQEKRASAVSLIDLDASLTPDSGKNSRRPSADYSDSGSMSSDPTMTPFGFDLERNNPIVAPFSVREPSLHISSETSQPATDDTHDLHHRNGERSGGSMRVDKELPPSPPYADLQMPPFPMAPDPAVLEGLGSNDDLKDELQRMVGSLSDHLKAAGGMLEAWTSGDTKGDSGVNILHA